MSADAQRLRRPGRRATVPRGPVARPGRLAGVARKSAAERVREASRAGLTTRAAALGLVVCALVISAALPLREYLAQRGRISQAEQEQSARRAGVAALERRRQLLDDPAYVAGLARQRLHFVLPGETTYVVLGPDPAPSPDPAAAGPVSSGPDAPWYSQLQSSLRSTSGATAPR